MTGAQASVFHLHPLQRCNLRCLHCYSDSSPHANALLAPARAAAAVAAAARWGYRALAVSGGEPLLYPALPAVLAQAVDLGMHASVVTNGLLCRTRADLDRLRHAHTVTVSVDGLAPQHDRMRGRAGAFAGAAAAVQRMADAGMRVWVACGITAHNVADIDALVALAAQWGAQGIDFHLVEPAGRALALPDDGFLAPDARVLLYVTVALLAAAWQDRIRVHVDLVHRATVIREPGLLYAVPDPHRPPLPADAIRVLVMYPDGMLLPVCHGFHPRYAVGHLAGDTTGAQLWDDFFRQTYPALTALAHAALRDLEDDPRQEVLNPGDWLAHRSLAQADAPPAPPIMRRSLPATAASARHAGGR